jgi:hypothetical protein
MTHENLPALNKYTSQTQYEALVEINETNSIVKIVQQGRSSKTLGALIRCMWIKQKDYTDANGVLREGWFVTAEGLHAMSVYKVKYDREQEEARKYAERVDKFEVFLLAFVEVSNANEPKIASLREELAELEKVLSNAKNEVLRWASLIHQADQNRILHKHKCSITKPYDNPSHRRYRYD